MARDHERYVEDVAPYVLGALAPLEVEAFEKHLRGCPDCQRELAELRPGAEVLSRSVEQIEPPASLRARVLEQVAAETSAAEATAAPHAPARYRPGAPAPNARECSVALERARAGPARGPGGRSCPARPSFSPPAWWHSRPAWRDGHSAAPGPPRTEPWPRPWTASAFQRRARG